MIKLLVIYSNLLIIANTSSSIKIKHDEYNKNLNTNEQTGILKRICLRNFKKQMENSSLSLPSGMGIYTCKCFLKQVRSGQSIAIAKKSCKEKATRIFQL